MTIKSFYKNEVKSYKKIDISTSFRSYYNTIRYNPHEGQCGTEYTRDDYKQVFRLAGVGYSSVRIKGKVTTTLTINLYGGTNKELNLTNPREKSYFLGGVNPNIRYDMNWIGMGAGLHMGNLTWAPINAIDESTFQNGTRYSPVMPEVYFRVGRCDILDLKYTYGFNSVSTFPVLLNELSIGSGFGMKPDFSLRYGLTVPQMDSFQASSFISAEGLVDKQIRFFFRMINEFPR